MRPTVASALALVLSCLLPRPLYAVDDEVAALRAELARLAARVAELEARLATRDAAPATTAATPPPAVVAAPPSTVAAPAPVPATTPTQAAPSVTVGGRIKLDLVFNHTSAGAGSLDDTLLNPGAIALASNGEHDQVDFSARASRLWLKSWTPTTLGDAGAYLELDLLGSGGNQRVSNGYGARLRHGYGELAGVLLGQTYTTFLNVGALPELNDDGINAGAVNVRQPLARITRPLAGGALRLGIEAPETTLHTASGVRLSPDDDRLPDLVLRYDHAFGRGEWTLAALAREIRIDDPLLGDDARLAAAGSLAGILHLGPRDTLKLSASGGTGLGRYLSFNAFEAGRVDAQGDIDLALSAGTYASWQRFWTTRWRTNLTAGYAWQDDDGAYGSENEALYTVHANLLWSPFGSTTLGIEGIYAARRRVDGADGEVLRLQFSAVHKF
ncbi:MAG: DcaP family trimeric outer membrane transporter [Gammaproteobacteria bacterium]